MPALTGYGSQPAPSIFLVPMMESSKLVCKKPSEIFVSALCHDAQPYAMSLDIDSQQSTIWILEIYFLETILIHRIRVFLFI